MDHKAPSATAALVVSSLAHLEKWIVDTRDVQRYSQSTYSPEAGMPSDVALMKWSLPGAPVEETARRCATVLATLVGITLMELDTKRNKKAKHAVVAAGIPPDDAATQDAAAVALEFLMKTDHSGLDPLPLAALFQIFDAGATVTSVGGGGDCLPPGVDAHAADPEKSNRAVLCAWFPSSPARVSAFQRRNAVRRRLFAVTRACLAAAMDAAPGLSDEAAAHQHPPRGIDPSVFTNTRTAGMIAAMCQPPKLLEQSFGFFGEMMRVMHACSVRVHHQPRTIFVADSAHVANPSPPADRKEDGDDSEHVARELKVELVPLDEKCVVSTRVSFGSVVAVALRRLGQCARVPTSCSSSQRLIYFTSQNRNAVSEFNPSPQVAVVSTEEPAAAVLAPVIHLFQPLSVLHAGFRAAVSKQWDHLRAPGSAEQAAVALVSAAQEALADCLIQDCVMAWTGGGEERRQENVV